MENGGNHERLKVTKDYESWVYDVCPDMIRGHPIFAEEPEEEQLLNEATFRAPRLSGNFHVPEYIEWLMQADPGPMYDYFVPATSVSAMAIS